MKVATLNDKSVIEHYLRRNTGLNIYSIGDLDPLFWSSTKWYGLLGIDQKLEAIVLIYMGSPIPTVIAFSGEKVPNQRNEPIEHNSVGISEQGTREKPKNTRTLLQRIIRNLPKKFYAHLSPGIEDILIEKYDVIPLEEYYRMVLIDKSSIGETDCSNVINLNNSHLEEILALYEESYPDNRFDKGMLETGQYFGLLEKNKLVSIGGVHVYSEQYRVAALGNVTTHPAHRGKMYGSVVVTKLCQSLLKNVDYIGLNVKRNNELSISFYKKLGFEIVAEFKEYLVELRSNKVLNNFNLD